ncbi:hypothetical protein [Herbaspirillum frisingense]|uniref:Restriction endonuclease n=1 Tax=Herbaspirillum frisingense TaxID=92645 RepID=A0ABU1PEG8_9BURK|nr:hypothetical protein [Herbaspirillum frisingense]MDR6584333.1 hypothetical protein [Herbaspirillum frisingense]
MADLKYDRAVYRDRESGELKIIRAENLSDSDTLSTARTNTLYDLSEQTELVARAGDTNAPHFAGKATEGRRLVQGERDKQHDKRVVELATTLQASPNWTLGLLGKRTKNTPPTFTPKIELFNYRWGNEINQIVDKETIVRHDVFGASNSLAMSVRQPAIAIEVINTHYPDEAAFNSFIQKSLREPFIVLFDVIQFRGQNFSNLLVKIDPDTSRLCYRAYTYWIQKGSVYKGDYPQKKIDSYARLKIEMEDTLTWFAKEK